MSNSRSGLSRRRALASLGLGAAAAAAVPGIVGSSSTAVASAGGNGDGDPVDGAAPLTVSQLVSTVPGVSYIGVNYGVFMPYDGTVVKTESSGGLGAYGVGGGGTLVAALDLPNGSSIYDMTVWGGGGGRVTLRKTDFGVYPWSSVIDLTLPAGVGVVTDSKQAVPPVLVDTSQSSFLLQSFAKTTATAILGVRIGYLPPVAPPSPNSGFVPINPVRAYDSRQAGYTNRGPLARNTNRVISIKDAHDAGGTVIAADVVPVGARAIACNLTATNTTAGNFLALTPGDATSFTSSAINWVGPGVSIANGLIVSIDASRQVTVWGGDQAGSTDFIIDVTGYFMPL